MVSHRRTRVRTGPWRTVLAALVVLPLLVLAGPAAAHSSLIGSDPADGASLQRAPADVTLRFNEDLRPEGAGMSVTGPAGANPLTPTVRGQAISAPWPAGLTSGAFTVAYRVVSADGHVVSGSISFTIAGATPTATPTASPTETPAPTPTSAGLPGWLWPALIVVLLVGAALIWLKRPRAH